MKKLIFIALLFTLSCSKNDSSVRNKKETKSVVIQIEEVTEDGDIYTLKPEKFTFIKE